MMKKILNALRADCPACGGKGGISDFGNWVNCAACKGTGQR